MALCVSHLKLIILNYKMEHNFDFLVSDFLLFLPVLSLLGVGDPTSEFSFSNILTCFSTLVVSLFVSIDSFLSKLFASSSSDSSSSSLDFVLSSISLFFVLIIFFVNVPIVCFISLSCVLFNLLSYVTCQQNMNQT